MDMFGKLPESYNRPYCNQPEQNDFFEPGICISWHLQLRRALVRSEERAAMQSAGASQIVANPF